MVALGNHERRNVLSDAGAAAYHNVRADDAELMYCSHAADDDEIIQRHVTGQRRVVGQDAAVAKRTIVRHVGVDHQQVIAAHLR